MSERKLEKKKFKKLKFEEVVDFLQEKNKESKCPVCDHDSWIVLIDEDSEEDEVNRIDLYISGRPSTVYAAYGVACVSCGFIRLHHMKAIRDWLDKDSTDDHFESEGHS